MKSGRSRRTPQPELSPQRPFRRTPKPERSEFSRSSRKTPATRVTKKRGRPASKAIADGSEDLSTSRVGQADKEGFTTKQRKSSKAQMEQRDAVVLTAAEVQGDGTGTEDAATGAAPSTRVKKRKKRKSIGQQSTSRAKAAKARSLLKPDGQPRERIPKQDLAETEGSLAEGVKKGPLVDVVPLDEGEPAHLPEVAAVMDSEVEHLESSKSQQEIAQKPKKRKRMPVEELPEKRAKHTSIRSKQAPKAPKTLKETLPAENAFDAVQGVEETAEVEARSLDSANEEQEAALGISESQEKPNKRKRVTVGQQPKKRAKAGVLRIDPEPKGQEETSTEDDVVEASHSVGKPAEVEVGSTGHVAGEQEAPAEGPEPQTHKPKRKKRKPIGQRSSKRKSADLATTNRIAGKTAASSLTAAKDGPTVRRGPPRAEQPPEEAIEEPQPENLGLLPEEQGRIQHSEPRLKSKSKPRRGRPKSEPIPKDAVDDPDEGRQRRAPEEEEEIEAPILPEKKKRGRPRKADAAQPTSQTTKPTKKAPSRTSKAKTTSVTAPTARAPPKNSIPITIYAPPSPTSDPEDDPLSTPRPPTTINAVDVLSQLCAELLSKSSSALADRAHADPSPATHAHLAHTKDTTDLYARELASRLLQLTTALNANTSLQARVKAVAKEERGLKKELKRLERERGDLRVRREEVVKERKKRELEELLGGIAGAVKRGWDMEKEGDAAAGPAGEVDSAVRE